MVMQPCRLDFVSKKQIRYPIHLEGATITEHLGKRCLRRPNLSFLLRILVIINYIYNQVSGWKGQLALLQSTAGLHEYVHASLQVT